MKVSHVIIGLYGLGLLMLPTWKPFEKITQERLLTMADEKLAGVMVGGNEIDSARALIYAARSTAETRIFHLHILNGVVWVTGIGLMTIAIVLDRKSRTRKLA